MPEKIVDFQKKSLKNLVIEALTGEWPLSAKKLYNIAKAQGINGTYQAVYKAINDLKENNIITKTENGYQLSTEWIERLKQVSLKMENAYSKQIIAGSDKPATLAFDSMCDFYKFFFNCFIDDPFTIGEKSICYQTQHVGNTLVGTDKEWEALKEAMKNKKSFGLVKCDTPLDNLFKKKWEGVGKKIRMGVDVPSASLIMDTMVIGDYVIQIYLPEEYLKEENRIYEKVKNLEDLDPVELHNLYWKKYKWINIIINKNTDVAERIRKETEAHFK